MGPAAPAFRLRVKVSPGSGSEGIQGWLGDTLKLRVTAPPERGKANAALLRVLATALDVPAASLRIVTGGTNRRKIVEIDGLSENEVRRRLSSGAGHVS